MMVRERDVGGTSGHLEGEDLETRMRQLEEAVAALRGDSRLANLPFGTLKEARSSLSVRSAGAAYPVATLNQAVTMGTRAFGNAHLRAFPFYLPSVSVVTKIGINVTTLGAGNLRLGIYADKGESVLYPGALILDAGVVNTGSTGVKSITIRRELPRGLYWLAMTQSGAPTLRSFVVGTWLPLGYDESGGSPYSHLQVVFGHAALPNPYPAGAVPTSVPAAYIFLKFG